MLERLEAIEKRYNELSEEMMNPDVVSNIKKTLELTKEQAGLKDAYEIYQVYKNVLDDINAAKEMCKDPDMSEFAKEELSSLEEKKSDLEKQIEILLLPKDPNDGKNVIVEIRGAAGGDEGNIFAGDLFDMYKKYCENQGWKIEILEEEKSDAGGYSLISFLVKGDNVYSKLKYESGAHRVQRVPVTETQGRVHTSTSTVLVMPEAEEIDFDLDMNEVKSRLHTDWAGCEVRYFDTLDSTNICAKRMAEEGAPNGTLVIADKQTAGRGRCGRVWETPKGTAIAMTLLMRPNLRPEKASMLTLVMGMAVTRAVNELYSLNCQIKWPNDVVWEGKKICGILVEMSAEMNAIHYLVIGCGINANMTEFPEELKEKAISLRMITGAEVDRAQIIQRSLEWLEKYYQKFEETSDMSGLMEEYNQMLVNRGSEVCVLDPCGEYRGRALGINDAGELLVEKEDGTTENVYAGEVSVRGVYGYV